jgi:hypothetical protein
MYPNRRIAIWNHNVFGKNSPNMVEKRSVIKLIAVKMGISLTYEAQKRKYTTIYTNLSDVGGDVFIETCTNSDIRTNAMNHFRGAELTFEKIIGEF